MRKFLYLLCTSIALLFFISAKAQSTTINGRVINADTKEPLIGATIVIKGSVEGAITDEKGGFKISTKQIIPFVLLFTFTGFEEDTIRIVDSHPVTIMLKTAGVQIEEVVVGPNRIPTLAIESPVTIERIRAPQITNSPATSYYDMAATLKGVDLTTASLTFKTISTRGFNGSGSSRVNQLVDGMDNQAPGLNFSIGNFVGLTELDVESMELLPGASSALYGPGGMNGTVLINSKNPFKHQGLSILARQGVMHVDKKQRSDPSPFYDYSLRWAKAFNNKFAFKIGAQYISAQDWLANDSTNYKRLGNIGSIIPGNRQTDPNYDGINVYGDETSVDVRPFIQGAIQGNPNTKVFLEPFLKEAMSISRTGYNEIDLVDPETKNIRLSGALHYKITENIEAQLMAYWGTGNTVYTGNNRYAFKNIQVGQYKLEVKHPQWFLRTYTTQENAGDAYSTTITAQYMNEAWKPSFNPANIAGSWYPQYVGAFATGAGTAFQTAFMGAKMSGKSDAEAMALAQAAVAAGVPSFHQAARAFADKGMPVAGSKQFNDNFNTIRKIPIPKGGRFLEKSQLWMSEGQYNFSNKIKFADILVGANIKKYILNSEGTLFIDTAKAITFNEIGAYVQITKKILAEKLTLSASGRYDKNEDFKGQFTPRATAVIRVAKNNNIRMSYQTAYRFPTTLQKYLRLNVGGYTLLGGLPWVMQYMQADKYPVYEVINGAPSQTAFAYKDLKPERMNSFEVGYKGLLTKNLLVDVYSYSGQYRDFLGRNILLQKSTGAVFVTAVNSPTKVKAHGFGIGIDYRLPFNFSTFINLYSDGLGDVPTGFQVLFNTPKYRVNGGFANSGFGKNDRFGFNIVFRWQDAFYWEGELANGTVPAFATVDAQVSYKFPKIKSLIKLGGTNITNHYYQNAFGNPKIGGLYYAAFAFNVF